VYVCNCNGIRERQVRAAIEGGAARPVEVFEQCGCRPQCARCIRDMLRMIDAEGEGLRRRAVA
jgi:bacterioferritin-associated ferredoxin